MIPCNNLSRKISMRREPLLAAAASVIDSGWFVLGSRVKDFEASFAAYLGASHCIGLGNGTDALELALRAVGVNRGDTVATIANACMYTTTALLQIGAAPCFMDVDINTRCAPLAEVKNAVEKGARAVVVTHLYGLLAPDIEAIAQYCGSNGIPLIEDCAQAHGAERNGKKAGTFGSAATFSFYPTKNLGALGDGGAVVTDSDGIASKVKLLRQYGWTNKYEVTEPGARNSRLDEMQAALLSVLLPDLDTDNKRRRTIAERYNNAIRNPAVLTPGHGGTGYAAHLYVVRTGSRDALRAHLKSSGVGTDVHYPVPDHRQPIMSACCQHVRLPNTEKLAEEALTLPCYPELTDDECETIARAVNAFTP